MIHMASPVATSSRPFEVGTTGWTVHDLDDPQIEARWFAGRYEIVEGVLTVMPPAYFAGGNAAFNLLFEVKSYLKARGQRGRFATEVDIVVDIHRVARSDAALLTPEQEKQQAKASKAAGKRDPQRTRILIPPLLVVESISPGHEDHDQRTKRRWYSEFGIPNYWIINAFDRSLECLVLDGSAYRTDVAGKADEIVRPSLFPGLALNLKQIWTE